MSCIDQFDQINCRAAVNFCDSELSAPMHASGKCLSNLRETFVHRSTGRNNYDIPKVGDMIVYLRVSC